MGKNSHIAWTDHTFNPWIGCTKVSDGCKFCYAERETFVRRERAYGRELWGPQGIRHVTALDYWKEPVTWNRQKIWSCTKCTWRGQWKMEKGMMCPDCGSKITEGRQRVFCMSLGDVLEDRPELVRWRKDLVDLIEATKNLDWLLLTKRPALMDELLPTKWFRGEWPANVWMGVSVEDQEQADIRVPILMSKSRARVNFLSVEPLLEPVTIYHATEPMPQWVIVGGESGPKCRPFKWDWARQIQAECRIGAVPFFMKQGGGYPNKRDNLSDMPDDLRIREWPT